MATANFLEGFAGQGLDQLNGNAVSTAYLSMVQPTGQAAADGQAVGTFRNTATNENYGNTVTVIPVAFKLLWAERDPATFKTIATYEPGSIKVDMKPLPAGKKGYPKMTNPTTGNEIIETFNYALILADHPEAGTVIFTPTSASLKACKNWNSQLRGQLLPNGAPAPIFAYKWIIACEAVQNPQAAGKIAKVVSVMKDSLVDEAFFTEAVQPKLASAGSTLLAIGQDESEVEE